MVTQWGIHLPNGDLENDGVFRMGVSHYNLLHLQATEFAYRARQASADGVIQVRFYLANWSTHDAARWAEECAAEYLRSRSWDGHQFSLSGLGCHVTPANEMNLSVEGGGSTANWYRQINTWLLAWIHRFQELTSCPTDRIHFPAFAYGHSDDTNTSGYVGVELCRPAIVRYGIINSHPYWFLPDQVIDRFYGHRFELIHARFPNKLIFCSELGNFDVIRSSTPEELIEWFESLPSYVIGGTPFIWEDPTHQHRDNDWSRNPAIGQRVAAHPKWAVVIDEEEPMPDEPLSYAFGFADLHSQYPEQTGPPTSQQYDIPIGPAPEDRLSIQAGAKGIFVGLPGGVIKFFRQTYPK